MRPRSESMLNSQTRPVWDCHIWPSKRPGVVDFRGERGGVFGTVTRRMFVKASGEGSRSLGSVGFGFHTREANPRSLWCRPKCREATLTTMRNPQSRLFNSEVCIGTLPSLPYYFK